MAINIDNPYESPRTTFRSLYDDRPWIGGALVSRVDRGFLYRRVVIEAPLVAVLEYHGNTVGETISIDGQVATRSTTLIWPMFAPRFDFNLLSQGRYIPVVVELKVSWWLSLARFRVEIAGQTIYSEGFWKPAG